MDSLETFNTPVTFISMYFQRMPVILWGWN